MIKTSRPLEIEGGGENNEEDIVAKASKSPNTMQVSPKAWTQTSMSPKGYIKLRKLKKGPKKTYHCSDVK